EDGSPDARAVQAAGSPFDHFDRLKIVEAQFIQIGVTPGVGQRDLVIIDLNIADPEWRADRTPADVQPVAAGRTLLHPYAGSEIDGRQDTSVTKAVERCLADNGYGCTDIDQLPVLQVCLYHRLMQRPRVRGISEKIRRSGCLREQVGGVEQQDSQQPVDLHHSEWISDGREQRFKGKTE